MRIQVFAGSLFPFRPNPIRISEKKKCDSHCWHSHCCRTFFAPMSHRTAGIRTFDIRTLVSFALLTPSHCWHSHCWLRTGVVRTSVFRTLVVQAAANAPVRAANEPYGELHTSTNSRSSDHERGEHTTKRLWPGRGPGQSRSNLRRSKVLR